MKRRLIAILLFLTVTVIATDSASAYYSTNLGRFISRDPIGYASGTNNLYEYVSGMPITLNDPTGNKDNKKEGLQECVKREAIACFAISGFSTGEFAICAWSCTIIKEFTWTKYDDCMDECILGSIPSIMCHPISSGVAISCLTATVALKCKK